MKKLLFILAIGLVFSTTALAVDIAISTKSGWWGQAAADQEMQDIVKGVKGASVQVFTINDLAALANWVKAHTGDGVPDLLIMCGNFPDTIYPAGNAQPNGSLAELFLDDGNTIINTGDYIFYVGTAANNDAGGLQNMMDLPTVDMWGDAALPCVPTAEGKQFTPSLETIPSTRPFFFAQLTGDWYPELILAQSADGTRGDPVIVRNKVTGGRLGIFYQVADVLTDLRGEVITEWINNWYIPKVASPKLASNPAPAGGAVDVPRDASLSWKPGQYAAVHDVYLGTTLADVNTASRTDAKGVLASKGQADATFDPPGSLAYGQTYYWRIDEVNKAPDNTIFKGDVWSFTVEPYAYPVKPVKATASSYQASMGPEKTMDGSGLDKNDLHGTEPTTMWMSAGAQPSWIQYEFDKVYKLHQLLVWNSNQLIEGFLGFGAKKVTIETSVDGTTWTALADVPEFAKATGMPGYAANTTVKFGGVNAKFVKLTILTNQGGMAPQTGLAEVRFFYVPVQARVPQPATGATGVSIGTTLTWKPGREAGSHKVFLGTDPNAVTKGTAAAKDVTDRSFTPDVLSLETTYYWRVDEVNTVTYPGDVWSFTTETFKVVDDFESYTDKAGAEVFSTWIDGLADNYKSGGSTVGLDTAKNGTFCETTIKHGGNQSMPLAYDNTKAPVSEAVVTFASPRNWTASGIKSLSLWFQGVAGNTGQLYVKINGSKVSYNGPAGDLAKAIWTPWNIDLSTTGANLSKVTSLTIGIEGAGAKGLLYIDDVRLYPKAPVYLTPADPGKANLVGLWTLDGNANDTSGKGNNGTVTAGTAQWVPGTIGQALQLNGGPAYVDCGTGASLNLTEALTITAWIKMDFTGGDRKIAGNEDNKTGGYKLGVYSNNFVEFEIRTAANASRLTRSATSGGTALQQGVWYFVAATFAKGPSGQTLQTYVFGIPDRALGTSQLLGTSTGSFQIGKEPFASSGYWLGALDDVRVYNKVLSQEEFLGVMGQTTPVAKPF